MKAEIKVGVLLLAVFAAAAVVIINLGDVSPFQRGYEFDIVFDNVADLPVRSVVKIAGVDVGRVKNITLEDGKAKVRVWIQERYEIRRDARASILRMGLIGNTYLSLTQGTPESGRIQEGDVIKGESPVDYDVVINRMLGSLEEVIEVFEDVELSEELGKNISKTFSNLEKASRGINAALGEDARKLSKTIENMNSVMENIDLVLSDKSVKISKTLDRFEGASEDLGALLRSVRDGEGAAGMMLSSGEFKDEVRKTIANIYAASEDLKGSVDRYRGMETSFEAGMYYDLKDEKFGSVTGVELSSPRSGRYLYAGVENINPEKNGVYPESHANSLTLLAGKELGEVRVFGGAIRSTTGAGVNWFWNDMVKFETKVFDFNRRRPWMNLSTSLKLTDFMNIGASYENILDEGRFRGGIELEIK